MKKNYLIISLFILGMIFSFTFKPLTAKADPVSDPEIKETTEENEDIEEKEEKEVSEPEVVETKGEETKDEVPIDEGKKDVPEETKKDETTTTVEQGKSEEQPKEQLRASDPPRFERTTASLEIKWDDNNDENGKRPKSISAILLTNGSSANSLVLDDNDKATHYSYMTLNAENNWTITISNIPKHRLVYDSTLKKYVLPKDEETGNEIREEVTYSWNIKYNWDDGNEPTEDYKITKTETSDITVDGEVVGVKTTMTNTYTPKEESVQTGKVLISKLDANNNFLPGAKLQIVNKATKEVIKTWVSGDTVFEIYLPAGDYVLQELEAPEGYVLADDKEFTVQIIIDNNIHGDVIFNDKPCQHYGGTALYYVEVESISYEVYCINQNWETPDGNSQYNGQLINENNIRNYTKQTNPASINKDDVRKYTLSTNENGETAPMDVSDPTLTDKQLYDKLINIIYHRLTFGGKIVETDSNGNEVVYQYSEEEIRFITEVALKNYTNPGLAEIQWNTAATPELLAIFDANGVVYKRYKDNDHFAEDKNGAYVSYLKHNYRDYAYNENAADNESIVTMVYGTGTSFGQMVAGHWASSHGANTSGSASALAARSTVKRYYKLFQLLISDENPHPEDMNLYIYSSLTSPLDLSGNDHDGVYQNLLGVTGYHKDVEIKGTEVKMTNNYSDEKTSVTVKKVWDDNNNQDGKRPTEITVKLSNGTTVTLNEENKWQATIDNLPKYNNGTPIKYVWTEDTTGLPEGYSLTNTEVEGQITTFTNSYTPKVRNIKVNKIWHDDNNQYHVRAKEVTVNILADDEVIKTITLNEDNGWAATLENLPVFKNGKEIKYEVSEFEVEYYKVIIEENEEGFTINNFYDAKGGEEPPKTSDNIYGSIIALIISVTGIVTCIYLRKRYN